jgi:hypothetical protein
MYMYVWSVGCHGVLSSSNIFNFWIQILNWFSSQTTIWFNITGPKFYNMRDIITCSNWRTGFWSRALYWESCQFFYFFGSSCLPVKHKSKQINARSKKRQKQQKGRGLAIQNLAGGLTLVWLLPGARMRGWDARRQEGGRRRSRERPVGRWRKAHGPRLRGRWRRAVSRDRRPTGSPNEGGVSPDLVGGVTGRGRECGRVAASEPHTTWTLEQSRAAGSGSGSGS